MPKRPLSLREIMLRDVLIALSLANLFFYKIWSELYFQPMAFQEFFIKSPPEAVDFLALFLNVFLLASVFWSAVFLARRSQRPAMMILTHLAFVVVLLIPIVGIYSKHGAGTATQAELYMRHHWVLLIAVMLAALVLVPFVLRWKVVFISAARVLLIAFSPFVVVTFGHGVWCIVHAVRTPAIADRPLAPRHPAPSVKRPRVFVMVFDEFDFRVAFLERLPTLDLPEMDRLRNESLFASNAFPPSDSTIMSFPAIIEGRLVAKAHAVSPTEVMILYDGQSKEVPWSEEPNLFSEAYGMGVNTAMVGWYLAYGRVLGNQLTFYSWEPHVFQRDGRLRSFAGRMLSQYEKLLPVWRRWQHIESYRVIRDDALRLAADHDIGLALIHFPIPHAPHIFNRNQKRVSLMASPIEGYLDNLALVDRCVGKLRATMESSGTWNETAIIISGDHGWRYSENYDGRKDERVPFLLKLPGQTKPLLYAKEFNNVLIHDLALAILRGELTAPEQAAKWLDEHRSIGLSPYSGKEKR